MIIIQSCVQSVTSKKYADFSAELGGVINKEVHLTLALSGSVQGIVTN